MGEPLALPRIFPLRFHHLPFILEPYFYMTSTKGKRHVAN